MGAVAAGCSLDELLAPPLTPEECPGALLTGTLAPDGEGGELVVTEFGEQPVRWPDGFAVQQAPELRLIDDAGNLVAVEGETVYVGGGMDAADEVFIACGYVSTEPP